jgi:ribosome-associated protein YbcJ (S4-like RNA binding protein)
MSLKPFAKTAKKCAKQLNVVLKASATAQSKAAAKVMSSEATVMVAGSVATKTDIV